MISVKSKKHSKLVTSFRHNGHQPFENQEKYWLPAMTDVKLLNNDYLPFKSTISSNMDSTSSDKPFTSFK